MVLTGAGQAAVSPNHGCVMETRTVYMQRMNRLPVVRPISTPVIPHTSNARITSRLFCV